MEMSARSKYMVTRFGELKAARLGREARWTEVNAFCGTGEEMLDEWGQKLGVVPEVGRKVYTGAGILNSKRLAALLVTYLINPVRPFLLANVESPRDASRGFITQNMMQGASQRYLSDMSWFMFGSQMRPKSGFMKSTALAMRDFVNHGPGIRFTAMDRQNRARWKHCGVINCWFAANEDGDVDTMYRREYYRLSRLVTLYPRALEHERLRKLHDAGKSANLLVQCINAVEPREGGVPGDVRENKPFGSWFFLPDYDGHVVQEEGFDTFPYSIARNDATEVNPYGVGIAEAALADLKALNHYQAGLENNLDLINEPPLLHLSGLFNKFSFEAGGLTEVDILSMPDNLSNSVMPLKVAGQVQPVMGFLQWLETRIGEYFFTDWLRLRENGTMTATEVNDRRDLRLRGVASLVPGIDEMFSHEADRLLELMLRRGLLPKPTPELMDAEVIWDYRGPLWDALKANQVDILGKMLAMWQGLVESSPEIADIIDIEAVIRNWVEGQGAEPGNLRSAEAVKQLQAQRQAEKAQEQQMAAMNAQATAMRDASQGVASLANGGDGRAVKMADQLLQQAA